MKRLIYKNAHTHTYIDTSHLLGRVLGVLEYLWGDGVSGYLQYITHVHRYSDEHTHRYIHTCIYICIHFHSLTYTLIRSHIHSITHIPTRTYSLKHTRSLSHLRRTLTHSSSFSPIFTLLSGVGEALWAYDQRPSTISCSAPPSWRSFARHRMHMNYERGFE